MVNLEQNNVVIDSVAGSGKTTTNLYIAKKFKNDNILLLTYNAKLKIETRERTNIENINNLEVHSYHSFGVKYYNNKCFTDTGINNVLNNRICSKKNIKFDIILLDEVQDMSLLYYELVCKINKDNKIKAKFCIMGDNHQSIFDFNGADERFIKYADKLFNYNKSSWVSKNLSTSFSNHINNERIFY